MVRSFQLTDFYIIIIYIHTYIPIYFMLDLNKLSNRLDTTNTVGFALFTGAFIVSRIDKREMKEDMRISKLEMKEDMRISKLEMKEDMEKMYNQTRADMKEMQIETQTNNRLTLLIAVLAIVILIFTK